MTPRLLLVLLLLPLSALTPPGCQAGSQRGAGASPTGAAVAFYRWYVAALDRPGPPPGLDDLTFQALVSPSLRKRLEQRRQSRATQEQDYFLRAQDVAEDWEANISVEPARIRGRTAQTVLSLGIAEKTRRRVAVSLVRRSKSWQIARVGPG